MVVCCWYSFQCCSLPLLHPMLDAIDACGLGSVTSQLVSKWKKSQSPSTSQRQPWIDCEAQASEFSGESKAERQWETLKDGSSQPTKRSLKRKQGSKDQPNNGSSRRREYWVKKIWMVLRHKMKKIFLTLMLKHSLKTGIISYFPTRMSMKSFLH